MEKTRQEERREEPREERRTIDIIIIIRFKSSDEDKIREYIQNSGSRTLGTSKALDIRDILDLIFNILYIRFADFAFCWDLVDIPLFLLKVVVIFRFVICSVFGG